MTLLIFSSIIGLFRLIFIAIIFFLLVKWISGLFSVRKNENNIASKAFTKNIGKKPNNQANKKIKTIASDKGEYVEFEEVE